MSEIQVNKISPQSGTSITLGDSGDTFTIPSGATITNSGTSTGFGESNTPYFEAKLSAGYTITSQTNTLLAANSEVHDSGGCYNNTNGSVTLNGLTAPAYSFTPNVAGKYFVYFVNGIGALADSNLEHVNSQIYFNNSLLKNSHFNLGANPLHFITPVSNAIITFNGTGDYVQFYTQAEDNSGNPFQQDGVYTQIGAFKVSAS